MSPLTVRCWGRRRWQAFCFTDAETEALAGPGLLQDAPHLGRTGAGTQAFDLFLVGNSDEQICEPGNQTAQCLWMQGSCYKSIFLGPLVVVFTRKNKGKKTKMIRNPLLR